MPAATSTPWSTGRGQRSNPRCANWSARSFRPAAARSIDWRTRSAAIGEPCSASLRWSRSPSTQSSTPCAPSWPCACCRIAAPASFPPRTCWASRVTAPFRAGSWPASARGRRNGASSSTPRTRGASPHALLADHERLAPLRLGQVEVLRGIELADLPRGGAGAQQALHEGEDGAVLLGLQEDMVLADRRQQARVHHHLVAVLDRRAHRAADHIEGERLLHALHALA